MFHFRKKKEENVSGIVVSPEAASKASVAMSELLLRGCLLFLFVYGAIGCYTSIYGISYQHITVIFVVLIVDLYLGVIFRRVWMKNIGYILLFLGFLAGIMFQARYVISGFYGLLNVTLERMGIMMNLSNVMSYNESVSDREMAITVFLCFTGVGVSTLLNALIANYKSVLGTALTLLPITLFGLYFGLVPDALYAIMLMSAFVILFIMKKGNRVLHKKLLLQFGAVAFILCTSFILLVNFLFPAQKIGKSASLSGIREQSDEYVARFVSGGLMGLFNRYQGAGGMSGGKLGGVAFVSPDFETDLIVRLTPYTTETMYLRGFTGISYHNSSWITADLLGEGDSKAVNRESTLLKKKKLEKQKMTITNIGADTAYRYLPYYSVIKESNLCHIQDLEVVTGFAPLNQPYEVSYYTDKKQVSGNAKKSTNQGYRSVPKNNYYVLSWFCKKAGLYTTDSYDEIEEKLANYFQQNYPYTKRPGLTPRNKDFVNYFLQESKTGYCAYYASAATLIYRYLGYEARYIEGYCIPYNRVTEGKPVNDTKEVDVEIDDSCAHAWVEVFEPGFGWRVVDVTPASMEEETTGSSLGFLDSLLGTGRGENQQVDSNYEQIGIDWERYTIIGWILLVIVSIMLLALLTMILSRKYQKYRLIHNADRSLALRSQYEYLCTALRKRENDFQREATYEQQLGWMLEKLPDDMNVDITKVLNTLNRASFSQNKISEEEFYVAQSFLEFVSKSLKKRG